MSNNPAILLASRMGYFGIIQLQNWPAIQREYGGQFSLWILAELEWETLWQSASHQKFSFSLILILRPNNVQCSPIFLFSFWRSTLYNSQMKNIKKQISKCISVLFHLRISNNASSSGWHASLTICYPSKPFLRLICCISNGCGSRNLRTQNIFPRLIF